VKFTIPRHRGSDVELDLPWPAVYFWTALPLLTGVAILLQRHAFAHPGRPIVYVMIVLLPWIFELAGITLPRPLFVALVLSGTLGLALKPVDIDIAPFPMVFMASEMGTIASLRESAVWAAAAMGLMAGLDIWGPYHQSFPWYIGIGLGWLGGVLVGFQVELLMKLRIAQETLAARAATDERRRIAREIHDVIAHSLTVMMLHVTGARRALGRDTRDASAALEEAERLGRQSLQDVRRAVGLLGESGDPQIAPMPGAADLAGLIDQFRSAGAQIVTRFDGEFGSLQPTTGLAVYRIVQESLTNAAKHAPGSSVAVTIRVGRDDAAVRVTNRLTAGPAVSSSSKPNGLGLWGMRERASLLGGSFEAGAEDGQWVVNASVPTARPTA